jgi:hypothetical protein
MKLMLPSKYGSQRGGWKMTTLVIWAALALGYTAWVMRINNTAHGGFDEDE